MQVASDNEAVQVASDNEAVHIPSGMWLIGPGWGPKPERRSLGSPKEES